MCQCGLCVFKHREHTLGDKEAQACTHHMHIYTRISSVQINRGPEKLGSGQLKIGIKIENGADRVLSISKVPFSYLSYTSSGQTQGRIWKLGEELLQLVITLECSLPHTMEMIYRSLWMQCPFKWGWTRDVAQ